MVFIAIHNNNNIQEKHIAWQIRIFAYKKWLLLSPGIQPSARGRSLQTAATYKCHVLGLNIVEPIPLNAMEWPQANGFIYTRLDDNHCWYSKVHTSSYIHCSLALFPSQLIWTTTGLWRSSLSSSCSSLPSCEQQCNSTWNQEWPP